MQSWLFVLEFCLIKKRKINQMHEALREHFARRFAQLTTKLSIFNDSYQSYPTHIGVAGGGGGGPGGDSGEIKGR